MIIEMGLRTLINKMVHLWNSGEEENIKFSDLIVIKQHCRNNRWYTGVFLWGSSQSIFLHYWKIILLPKFHYAFMHYVFFPELTNCLLLGFWEGSSIYFETQRKFQFHITYFLFCLFFFELKIYFTKQFYLQKLQRHTYLNMYSKYYTL